MKAHFTGSCVTLQQIDQQQCFLGDLLSLGSFVLNEPFLFFFYPHSLLWVQVLFQNASRLARPCTDGAVLSVSRHPNGPLLVVALCKVGISVSIFEPTIYELAVR